MESQPKLKVYISGKMTGVADLNRSKFDQAEQLLKNEGFEPVNPHKLDHSANVNESWEEFMRVDLAELLKCDAIALIDDWHDSKGAIIEFRLAQDLKMPYIILGSDIKSIVRKISMN
ncbi:DUF4406 domain-containing protein [Solitalea koreensis]|uniref:Nucleoside 2-deoxyribosyltransferase n=1 Tax=Solitalea koreensis TaxID=543615 RepID=A0A521BP11_9SPHI|nr:DUF4406 domain-containing protein [Solitalea koreensis]SMO48300.1 protein of unknown function [Solitalea koreensis]